MAPRKYGEADGPLTYRIIDCAIRVHKRFGAGMREETYDDAMTTALRNSGLPFIRQPRIRIPFEGQVLDRYYRPDYVIENEVILEVKSIKNFLPVHDAQILTYMRLANIPKGLLINFNVALLVHGIRRFILTKAPPGASGI
jgi:GxxExxY protein